MVKAATLAFCIQHSVKPYQRCSCRISYSLLILVSRYWAKLRRSHFRFPDFGQFLIKRNCHKSSTGHDIAMKFGPVTKLDKRNNKISKKNQRDIMSVIVTSLLFFQFTANSEQSGSHIPDAQSVKLIFSLIVTFYLTKTESRTKKPLTQLSHYCFE